MSQETTKPEGITLTMDGVVVNFDSISKDGVAKVEQSPNKGDFAFAFDGGLDDGFEVRKQYDANKKCHVAEIFVMKKSKLGVSTTNKIPLVRITSIP